MICKQYTVYSVPSISGTCKYHNTSRIIKEGTTKNKIIYFFFFRIYRILVCILIISEPFRKRALNYFLKRKETSCCFERNKECDRHHSLLVFHPVVLSIFLFSSSLHFLPPRSISITTHQSPCRPSAPLRTVIGLL